MKDYIQELNELRDLLKILLNKEYLQQLVELSELIDKSYVSSYCRIVENSEHGVNCGYAGKAKKLFLQLGEKDISNKIEYIYNTFLKKKH